MSDRSSMETGSRIRWSLAALAVIVLNGLGLASPQNFANNGMTLDTQGVVTDLQADGPAARAGVLDGDRVVTIDGVPFATTRQQFQPPRPTIGDRRAYRMARGDETFDAAIVFGRAAPSTVFLFAAATVVGLTFLGCGLFVLFKRPTSLTRLAGLLGLSGMIGFGIPPYVADRPLRILLSMALVLAGTMMMPLMLEICLRFPDRPRLRFGIRTAIHLPVVFLVAVFVSIGLLAPERLAGLYVIPALLTVAYGIAAWIAAAVRWRRSPHGVTRKALGTLVGAILFTLAFSLFGALVPGVPGGGFFFLSVIVVPVAIATGLMRATDPDHAVAEARR